MKRSWRRHKEPPLTESESVMTTSDTLTENEAVTSEISSVEPPAPPEEPTTKSPRRKRFLRLRQFWRVGAGVWLGLLLTAGGFGLLAYTWSQTAALVDVALQVPFLVSGGLVGLGLILVGLLVINLAAKKRDALDRQRQLDEVREALVRLRAAIEGDDE